LGKAYQLGKQKDKAVETYKQYIVLAQKTGRTESLDFVQVLGRLAQLYADQNQFDAAFELHKRAFAFYQSSDDKVGTAVALSSMSALCRKRGKLDKALECAERGFAIVRHYYGSENYPMMGRCWDDLAAVHEGQQRHAKATEM
jgi:tetratricopeptide (TPR) repeat protein